MTVKSGAPVRPPAFLRHPELRFVHKSRANLQLSGSAHHSDEQGILNLSRQPLGRDPQRCEYRSGRLFLPQRFWPAGVRGRARGRPLDGKAWGPQVVGIYRRWRRCGRKGRNEPPTVPSKRAAALEAADHREPDADHQKEWDVRGRSCRRSCRPARGAPRARAWAGEGAGVGALAAGPAPWWRGEA